MCRMEIIHQTTERHIPDDSQKFHHVPAHIKPRFYTKLQHTTLSISGKLYIYLNGFNCTEVTRENFTTLEHV
jgi:hypothetical protein